MTHRRRPRGSARTSVAALAASSLLIGLAVAASPAPATPAGADPSAGAATVEPRVWRDLAADETTSFWVYLRAEADLSTAAAIANRSRQGKFVVDELISTAERGQARLVDLLASEEVDYETFWIANAVRVTGDAELLRQVASLPNVEEITADRVYEVPEPTPTEAQPRVDGVEWGVDRIGAPRVWDEFGTTGEGLVVGVIDTGVQHDHPALVEQYRGNTGAGQFDHDHNWYDPSTVCGGQAAAPCDNVGHGTHVTGTIVGDDGGGNRIGVAPGAQWIAAKGCEDDAGCSQQALLASAQFMLAPTDRQGRNPRPELRPHVVNNSWGSSRYTDPWFAETVRAWVAAGIFPQFAAGNSGPACDTAGNPGNLPESYAAGAFDIDNAIYARSSRGPGAWDGSVKPNLAAPGVAVRSAYPGDTFAAATGTSMASPHVAGSVALLWSAAPSLVREIDATRELLDLTAIDTEDLTCGGTPEDNNVWGQGRLDVQAAVDTANRSPAGTLSGTVTDAGTGEPVADVTITVSGDAERERVTGADGRYSVRLPAGEFTVTAVAFGYRDQTAPVTVTADQTTRQDLTLEKVDHVTVSGRVTDGSGQGWPLYAEITAGGTPVGTFTDPRTGAYSLSLPAGESYSLTVAAQYPGYPERTVTVEATGDRTFDVALDVAGCEVAPGFRSPVTIGILGDRGGMFAEVLAEEGVGHAEFNWGDDPSDFDVIVVNLTRDPGAAEFERFLAETDAAGTGVVFLDNGASIEGGFGGNQGIRLLRMHTGNPSDRATGWGSRTAELYYEVVEDHPVLEGFEVGEQVAIDRTDDSKVYASFDGYTGAGRTVVANAGTSEEGILGGGVGVQQRDRNRHVLLSMHAATLVFSPVNDQPQHWLPRLWTDDARKLFRNALEWASPTSFECVPVEGGLVLGQITDRNTAAPVAEAAVTTVDDPDTGASSAATPDDSRLGDGFYWFFSPRTGAVELTATARRYAEAAETVEVTAADVNPVDLALPAGRLDVDLSELEATRRPGQPAQRTFTVTNTGTAPAELEIYERRGHRPPVRPDGSATPRRQVTRQVTADVSPVAAARLGSRASAAADGGRPAAAPWRQLATYPVAIMDNATATAGGALYSFGGYTPGSFGGTIQDRAFVLDPTTWRWREIARMPQPRDKPAAVEIDGKIYVVGGWDDESTTTATTYIYDPDANSWSRGADLPAGRAAAGAAVVDGALYIVGGCATSSCAPADSVWRYEPDRDEWAALPAYPDARSWLGCGGLAGQVLCTGGTSGDAPTSATYSFDPDQQEWTPRANAPYPSWGMAHAAADGRLVISGGATEASGAGAVTNQGAAYHPGEDAWTAIEPTDRPVFRAGGACGFYKVGGATGSLQQTAAVEAHPDFAECDATDLPWLTVEPTTATLPAGESLTVTVSMDPDEASPGVHTGGVGLRQQTPYVRDPVDVTLTVRTPVACDREVTGTHRGPLTVTSGTTCVADGAEVTGRVTVRPGAGLVVGDATLRAAVAANRAELVELVDAWVTGPLTVRSSTGGVTLQDNRLTGTVVLADNGTGDLPLIVSGNSVVGRLSCTGNDPAPVNEGVPNSVTGSTTGQCAGL